VHVCGYPRNFYLTVILILIFSRIKGEKENVGLKKVVLEVTVVT